MLAFKALEASFISLLTAMTLATGLFGLAVIVRLVEPRGLRAFLRRLSGRSS
ncbi:MAG: hypothetical protein HY775_08855 [Acidobacteria bacterium]|nr:hypothetical protein [Acidobacteriota bacterium]